MVGNERCRGAKKTNRRRGKLALLPKMPLDILCEILGRLPPLDLLHLARTTKAFRAVLMHRSARHIWTASLGTISGLPACPAQLAEPQYASLVSEPRCSFCGAMKVQAIYWEFHARCCSKCLGDRSKIVMSNAHYVRKLEQRALILSCAVSSDAQRSRDISGPVFLRAELERVRETLTALADDPAATARFVHERNAREAELTEHALHCRAWHRSWTAQNTRAYDDAVERRRAAIFQQLKDVGWGTELARLESARDVEDRWTRGAGQFFVDLYYKICRNSVVDQPKELTPRIWNNIKDTMIEIMEEVKEERIRFELVSTLNKRISRINPLLRAFTESQPAETATFVSGDLYELGALDEIFDWPPGDGTTDAIPDSLFDDLVARLPALAETWRRSVMGGLLALLPNATASSRIVDGGDGSPDPRDLSRLELATTLFACSTCPATLHCWNVVAHPCNRPDWLYFKRQDEARPRKNRSRDLRNITCDIASAASATVVVNMCGLDPATASAADMDAAGARFTCVGCYDYSRKEMLAMDWRNAVIHRGQAELHVGTQSGLLRLSESNAVLAKRRERDARAPFHYRATCRWMCRLCSFSDTAGPLEQHMRHEHGEYGLRADNCWLSPEYFAVPTPFRNVRIKL